MKTATERKNKTSLPFEVKAVDEEKRTFRGIAAAWTLDQGRDVIHRGAFSHTLNRWRESGGKNVIFLLDSHNPYSIRSVLGKMVDAVETEAGLEAEFVVIDGPDGDETMRRIKGGFISGLSIGYRAVKWDMEQVEGGEPWDQIRHLREVKLLEVSLVVFPMNEDARIDLTSVKSLAVAIRDASLTDEEKTQLRALLDAPPPPATAEEPKGVAPDDPRRLETEALLRDITLRQLAVG